jgi:hypothetical protein
MAAAAEATPPFAFLWQNALLSDYKLVITSPNEPQQQHADTTSSPDVRGAKRRRLFGLFSSAQEDDKANAQAVLHVHGAVLTAASEHFKSTVENCASRTLEIKEPLARHAAVRQLVKVCYVWALDDELDQSTLVTVMHLAEKYKVARAITACAQRFAGVRAQELLWETVQRLFQLPDALQNSGAFEDVMRKARAKLFAAFSTLDTAMNCPELRATLLALPLRALELLLASDQLHVVSENTALVAAAAWLGHERGREAHSRAVYELLRLQHLSHTFLGDVLPGLRSFAGLLQVADCLRVAQFRAADPATRRKLHLAQPGCSLFLPPRATHPGRTVSLDITLQVGGQAAWGGRAGRREGAEPS